MFHLSIMWAGALGIQNADEASPEPQAGLVMHLSRPLGLHGLSGAAHEGHRRERSPSDLVLGHPRRDPLIEELQVARVRHGAED